MKCCEGLKSQNTATTQSLFTPYLLSLSPQYRSVVPRVLCCEVTAVRRWGQHDPRKSLKIHAKRGAPPREVKISARKPPTFHYFHFRPQRTLFLASQFRKFPILSTTVTEKWSFVDHLAFGGLLPAKLPLCHHTQRLHQYLHSFCTSIPHNIVVKPSLGDLNLFR